MSAGMFKRFGYAFKGIKTVFSSEQNFRIHFAVACCVAVAGVFAKLNLSEWCIILLTIFMVLAMETMNTAVEKLVDFISPGFHQQAGMVKDVSAAAVLLTAIAAVIIGVIIFLPKFF